MTEVQTETTPKVADLIRDTIASNAGSLVPHGNMDIDIIHAMDARDSDLIADEIMYGARGRKFIYAFNMDGKQVAGISVIGAAHIANIYGGLQHRIVATVEKRGKLFVFTSYPHGQQGMDMRCAVLAELEGEDDFFRALIEVKDIKTGNSIQVEKTETKMGQGSNGKYAKPHYQIIAESKAYRNAVLRLLPQDVLLQFKAECLRLDEKEDITVPVLRSKRDKCVAFAAKHAIMLSRESLSELTFAQLEGLAGSVELGIDAFKTSATALKLVRGADQITNQGGSPPAPGQTAPRQAGPGPAKAKTTKKKDEPAGGNEPPVVDEHGTPVSDAGAPAKAAAANPTAETKTDTKTANADSDIGALFGGQ